VALATPDWRLRRTVIFSKDDLRRYSIEELEKMCPKDKRLFVRLKKMKTVYG
jgi:hypothetical protein